MDTTISGLQELRTNTRSSRRATSMHSPVTHAVLLRQHSGRCAAIDTGLPPLDLATATCRMLMIKSRSVRKRLALRSCDLYGKFNPRDRRSARGILNSSILPGQSRLRALSGGPGLKCRSCKPNVVRGKRDAPLWAYCDQRSSLTATSGSWPPGLTVLEVSYLPSASS